MKLEIQKRLGGYVSPEWVKWTRETGQIQKIQSTILEIGDTDGVSQTLLGPVSLSILKRDIYDRPTKIRLEGDVLKGTAMKNRRKRKDIRIIDLRGGGAQTISKREVLIVRP